MFHVFGGQLGHYLQVARQAWIRQPGILNTRHFMLSVQPFVLSLQELVGCHYGQWSTLSKFQSKLPPRCSNRSKVCNMTIFVWTGLLQTWMYTGPTVALRCKVQACMGRCRLQAISSNPNLLRCGKILDLEDHLYAGREGKWPSWALGTESNVSVSIASFSYSQLHNVMAYFDLHLVLLS